MESTGSGRALRVMPLKETPIGINFSIEDFLSNTQLRGRELEDSLVQMRLYAALRNMPITDGLTFGLANNGIGPFEVYADQDMSGIWMVDLGPYRYVVYHPRQHPEGISDM